MIFIDTNKNDWINKPLILKGKLIDLVALENSHFEELIVLAKDPELWRYTPNNCSVKETFLKVYKNALDERKKAKQYPFTIFHKKTNRIIGSTRFVDIATADRKLEIGGTWITSEYWSTCANLEAKLLLLTFCFEYLNLIRVQFKANVDNVRSRMAILKIGARFEGILRNEKIQDNGVIRHAAYYSILDTEWSDAKQKILGHLLLLDPAYNHPHHQHKDHSQ